MVSVRSTRSGRPFWRLTRTVSVSDAWSTACLSPSCTLDSTEASIRVPICTPSAPRAKAAAIEHAVGDAAGGDEGHVELVGEQGQQHRRRHLGATLEPGTFDALDDEAVDAGVDRLLGGVERGDDMEDLDAGGLEDRRVRHR